MSDNKKVTELEFDELNEPKHAEHVHGPGCNHHHHAIKPIERSAPKLGRNDLCVRMWRGYCRSGRRGRKRLSRGFTQMHADKKQTVLALGFLLCGWVGWADVVEPARRIPVAARVDVVIAGGGMAGVAAALEAAAKGRTVMVVAPRLYLGEDLADTMRPLWKGPSSGICMMLSAACLCCHSSKSWAKASSATSW